MIKLNLNYFVISFYQNTLKFCMNLLFKLDLRLNYVTIN